MQNKLNLTLIVISIIVAMITILISFFGYMYVLRVIAESGLYFVGNIDTISFFSSGNFAEIGYKSVLTTAQVAFSKPILILGGVLLGIIFITTSLIILVEKIALNYSNKNFKAAKPEKVILWFLTKYKVFLICALILLMNYLLFAVAFLHSANIIGVIQDSIIGVSSKSQYCKILINPKESQQVLRVNLENNYKLSWTYYGLVETTLSGEDAYYPNKITDDTRKELIKDHCQ